MGWGTGNLGGGSGGLNFKIVGGASEPSNPRENLIWVNTEAEITSWIFSANEPENPESGMVWISTGSSSNVAFNAMKKNGIFVYPISAKQYIGGGSTSVLGEDLLGEMVLGSTTNTDSQWMDVTAKSYQGGKWRDWIVYLFNDGDEYESFTGGWKSLIEIDSRGDAISNLTVTNTGSVLQLTKTDKSWSVAHTGKKIDLTNYNTAYFDIREGSWLYDDSYVYVCAFNDVKSTAPTSYSVSAQAKISKDANGTYAIDLSGLSGEHYVGLLMTSVTQSESFDIQIARVYLK